MRIIRLNFAGKWKQSLNGALEREHVLNSEVKILEKYLWRSLFFSKVTGGSSGTLTKVKVCKAQKMKARKASNKIKAHKTCKKRKVRKVRKKGKQVSYIKKKSRKARTKRRL